MADGEKGGLTKGQSYQALEQSAVPPVKYSAVRICRAGNSTLDLTSSLAGIGHHHIWPRHQLKFLLIHSLLPLIHA